MDDYPDTLRLLSALLGHRTDREDLGYQPTEFGAFVDWDRLATGKLSSTEIGTVRIAHGCATLERHGGAPPAVSTILAEIVAAVS